MFCQPFSPTFYPAEFALLVITLFQAVKPLPEAKFLNFMQISLANLARLAETRFAY